MTHRITSYLTPLELSLDDDARHPAQVAYGPDDPEHDSEMIALFFEAMERWKGVGLAAPQVGISSALAVVQYHGERYVLSNPEITRLRVGGVAEDTEGCLSLPGRRFNVTRSLMVNVTCYDQHRGSRSFMVSGWLARIFQHECDHLRGILIDTLGAEVPAESAVLTK